jgi:polysaccharide biosynthesis PFTS motif protein
MSIISGFFENLVYIFPANSFFRKGGNLRYSRRIANVMRGYRILKLKGQLDLVPCLKSKLIDYSFLGVSKHASTRIFGNATSNAELHIRQYLISRLANHNLNGAILYAIGSQGKVVYPLPKPWQKILSEDSGVEVNAFLCSLLWFLLVFTFIPIAFLRAVYLLFIFCLSFFTCNSFEPDEKYIYFVSLSPGNFPGELNQNSFKHSILDWYIQWQGKANSIQTIFHDVLSVDPCSLKGIRIKPVKDMFHLLIGPESFFQFCAWLFILVIWEMPLHLVRGHWWNILALPQSIDAAIFRFSPSKYLACEYWFHNSAYLRRPLWTYEATFKGSKLLHYFYSTNCESFKRSTGLRVQTGGWKLMNWPVHLVWDDYQKHFIQRLAESYSKIIVAGPIWFQPDRSGANCNDCLTETHQAISVFDVQPYRDSIYQMLDEPFRYYIPEISIQFINDILSVAEHFGASVFHKRKRNIGNRIHPSYEKAISRLSQQKRFVSLDPDFSSINIIQNSSLVISMPFTSTAILGRSFNKPSVYYDPSGLIQKDDRAAHGIEVLCGEGELKNWLERLL